jgi:chemotaxis protein methyltransferase CheR
MAARRWSSARDLACTASARSEASRQSGASWRVDERLQRQIRWTTANLVDPDAVLPLARADVIFCRNVFIYFADDTIRGIARTLADGLADDGVLFLGSAESLTRLATDFELTEICGAFAYVKGRAAGSPRSEAFAGAPTDGWSTR